MISFASKLNERTGSLLIEFRRCAAVLRNKYKKLIMKLIKSFQRGKMAITIFGCMASIVSKFTKGVTFMIIFEMTLNALITFE
jgi:hypothetical protein